MPCRRDQRALNAKYYAANREREIERVRRRQNDTSAFLRDLRRVPCADCGRRFEPFQMDFDHLDPTLKAFNICSGGASLKSHSILLSEVAKCEVVCANCHRIRSRRQRLARLPAERDARLAPAMHPHRRWIWRWHQDLLDQLRDVPCLDCGGRFPPCAMEFDHRNPAEKSQGVTRMIGRASAERILAEVDKCDIVCANCHRMRTFERRNRPAA